MPPGGTDPKQNAPLKRQPPGGTNRSVSMFCGTTVPLMMMDQLPSTPPAWTPSEPATFTCSGSFSVPIHPVNAINVESAAATTCDPGVPARMDPAAVKLTEPVVDVIVLPMMVRSPAFVVSAALP